MKKIDQKTTKKFAKLVAAPKVKKYGDARDNPDYGRARCTMPSRTRAGKSYPGGRRLRRALARLASAQKGINECRANAGKAGKRSLPADAFMMPGAMHP